MKKVKRWHHWKSVLRDGKVSSIDIAELVPGDIVAIRGGQAVPADGIWLDGDIVKVDTAALTGEPIARTIPKNDHDQGKKLLAGCILVQGECRMLIQATGKQTQVGQATEMVANAKKGPNRWQSLLLYLVIRSIIVVRLFHMFYLYVLVLLLELYQLLYH